MKAEKWNTLLEWYEPKDATDRPAPWWLEIARGLSSDLAESERLRAKAEDDRNQWRSACADETNRAERAETLVAAYVKLVAQSSTQYREMVKAFDEYSEHRSGCHKVYRHDTGTCTCGLDAVLNERSTP